MKLYGLALAALVLAGVIWVVSEGHSKHGSTTLLRGPASCVPAEGQGTMGECTPKPVGLGPGSQLLSLRGPFVVDVSYFQGTVNWAQAKPHISGAIVRVADGNFNDPAFARNWRELKRLHVWHAAYFFLRPGNCTAEADRAVALTGPLDSGPIIADAEVPLNYGCAAAFVREAKRRTGLPEAIYTAPGTWPGGPHGGAVLWVASYGPRPGCVWTCSYVAWQATDGVIGPFPHCTPGIGCGDISTDNGITKLGRTPPKPKPSPSRLKRQLARELDRRSAERRFLTRHHCRRPPWHTAKPVNYAYACRVELQHGKITNRIISALRAKGA